MSDTVAVRAWGSVPASESSLTGTALLLRLALRRDRIKIVVWPAGIALFVVLFANNLRTMASQGRLSELTAQMSDAMGMLQFFVGPAFGLDQGRIELFFLMYTQEFLLAAALMNLLLIIRHTRGEEEHGRTELVRSAVIGRHAPLTAAMITALITNALTVVLVTGTTLAIGFAASDAVLFGVGVGLTGMIFAGVTAISCQLTEGGRAAGALVGLLLAVAFMVRGVGSVIDNDGWLVWLSPFSWAPMTRVMVEPRIWPLAIPIVVAACCFAVGYVLSARRDVGAGLLPTRAGRVRAAGWLRSSLALAYRLQRGSLGWWLLSMTVLAVIWGALVNSVQLGMIEGLDGDIVAGYLSLMGVTQVLVVGGYVVIMLYRLKTEETSGRLEAVLSTSTGRVAWLGSWTLVTGLGVGLQLIMIGAGIGLGGAATTGNGVWLGVMLGAVTSRMPELLVLLAIGALLYGLAPRLLWLTWLVLGYGVVIRFFGQGLPGWLIAASPFQHLARIPVEGFTATPVAVLLALAAVGFGIGQGAFRRRSL
ncbi:ABC transporter permease [Microlunatus parietis]|uniref:ABC-2 type transport system permease protein n=1 Tax=Microlunatus parietis TaxID=682979 RepID=A0A7Y9ICS4_9ACTN|nr:ABC transporter permease [Microlunatus parietis]NYE74228.1 ABC-2 type transport system permease protein [Microlunatus parietis]